MQAMATGSKAMLHGHRAGEEYVVIIEKDKPTLGVCYVNFLDGGKPFGVSRILLRPIKED